MELKLEQGWTTARFTHQLHITDNFTLAINESVRFVIIAGDFYDTDWKDYNTALFLAKQMSRLRVAGIGAFVVTGNHDAGNQITRTLSMPENVKFLSAKRPETVVIDDLGVALHGQGFAERAVREDLSAGYPTARKGLFNIGILHTAGRSCTRIRGWFFPATSRGATSTKAGPRDARL